MSPRYTANLAAHLTKTTMPQAYESIEELRQDDIPIFIARSHYDRQIFETRFDQVYRDIVANDWFYSDHSDILSHLKKGEAVYAMTDDLEQIERENCDLGMRRLDYTMSSRLAGFVMRKDHPFLASISRQIIKYLADGRILNITEKYAEAKCPHKKEWSLLPRADLPQMTGLLVVTAVMAVVGVGVALLQSLLEWIKIFVGRKVNNA